MRLLSYIYLLITTIRNFLYDEKILPIRKVPGVEVICIGNVSVGGTGKPQQYISLLKNYWQEEEKLQLFLVDIEEKEKEIHCL